VTQHEHSVRPVRHDAKGYEALKPGPIMWHNSFEAYGKVEKVALSGSFLMEFRFEATELENWLMAHVKENPSDALRLIGKAQAEAMIALAQPETK